MIYIDIDINIDNLGSLTLFVSMRKMWMLEDWFKSRIDVVAFQM